MTKLCRPLKNLDIEIRSVNDGDKPFYKLVIFDVEIGGGKSTRFVRDIFHVDDYATVLDLITSES